MPWARTAATPTTRAAADTRRTRPTRRAGSGRLVVRVPGFEILGRNVRLGHLELNVVTPKGPLGVVTEVRTRGQGALAGVFASVTAAKRARPRTAVDRLGRKHIAAMPSVERVRIDVAAVTFDRARTRIEYAPGVV